MQRKEKVVHREAGDIIRGFSPFSSRTIEQTEVTPVSKQNVPRMKIAVDLPQSMNAVFQPPPPIDALLFDVLKPFAIDRIVAFRITIDESHNAFRMAHEFPDAPDIQIRVGAFDLVNVDKVIA